jgi:hypothetical protein
MHSTVVLDGVECRCGMVARHPYICRFCFSFFSFSSFERSLSVSSSSFFLPLDQTLGPVESFCEVCAPPPPFPVLARCAAYIVASSVSGNWENSELWQKVEWQSCWQGAVEWQGSGIYDAGPKLNAT